MGYNLYTKEEDDIIINEVKNYPTNLGNAFEEASKKLQNRSAKTVSQRWYKHLKHNESVVTVGSKAGFTKNVKNTKKIDGVMQEQNLKHYLVVVKELLDLPDKERKLVLNLFMGNTMVNQK